MVGSCGKRFTGQRQKILAVCSADFRNNVGFPWEVIESFIREQRHKQELNLQNGTNYKRSHRILVSTVIHVL